MGYIEGNLQPGEYVVYEAQSHWFIFMPGIVSSISIFLFLRNDDGTLLRPAIGAGTLSIVLFIRAYIRWASTELAVTSRRVIVKMGFIQRHTIELNHSKVESFDIHQGVLGRIFDYGTIVINGTGGGQTTIPNIVAPLEFRRKAMEEIDRSGERQRPK